MNVLPPNPRYDNIPAISWSDLVRIERNVGQWYREQTGQAKKPKASPSMAYGTFVHAQIAKRKLNGIPHGDSPEHVYTCEIKDGRDAFIVVGRIDDADADTIYEYKTCTRGAWSRIQASTHGQLAVYALLRFKNGYPLPSSALLVSLATKRDEDAGIYITGDIHIHTVPITHTDILKIQARFIKAYRAVKKYVKDNGIKR